VTALVKIEIVEDLLEELRVLSGKLPNARLNFAKKMGDGLLGDTRVLLFGDLPGGLHHADEVLVRWGAHGQVGVVVLPLLLGDLTVVVTAGAIEVVKEVHEDLLTGLAALKELGVHANVIDGANVSDVDDTRAVSVHHGEGLVDHGQSARGKLVSIFKSFS